MRLPMRLPLALGLALVLLAPLVPAAPEEAPWWMRPLPPEVPVGMSTDLVEPPAPVSTPVFAGGDDVVVPIANNQDEFSIAANPLDPDNLVAGANDYCCSAVKAGFFTTFDGGATWVHGIIPTPGHVCGGDPAIGAGPDGTFWYIGITGYCGDGRSTVFASYSKDGGLTWTTTEPIVSNGPFEDKPYVAVDPKTGAVAISWTRFGNADITITISRDSGATWSPYKRLGGGQFSQPVFAPNGDVYVTWAGSSGAQFVRSTDGGATWQTFATGLVLGLPPAPPGWVPFRYAATPTIAVVPGGMFEGRIYLAGPRFTPNANGGVLSGPDIAIVHSDDRGETWSPVDVLLRPGVQMWPWMAVMPDGTVGISYMDSILTAETWGPLLSRSDSGGLLLSQSLSYKKPSELAWTTTLLTDIPSDSSAASFWGDYQGLAATSKGFHPAFGDARDSVCGCGANNGYPDFATMRVAPFGLPAP